MTEVEPPQFGAPATNNNNNVKTFQQIMSESQLARSERRIQNMEENSFYLPGLGVIKDYVPSQVRPQRSKSSTIHPTRFKGETANIEFPAAQSISPVSVTVSERNPPPGLPSSSSAGPGSGSKCEYVQMKGDQHMLESNCMRGGMSCERSCSYDTSEPVCTETFSVKYISFCINNQYL